MDRFLRPHSDCTDRERFLRGHFGLAGVAAGLAWDDDVDVALVAESAGVNCWDVQADPDLVYVIAGLAVEYRVSMLSKAMIKWLKDWKKVMGSSRMFL